MKVSRTGPTAPVPKACTLLKTPERVRNVPNNVRRKVTIPRMSVQDFIDALRCISIELWRKAVPVSHGRKLAFSTGSHAQ